MAARILTLNVGGLKYTTTTSTLCRAPFFEAMLRNESSMRAMVDHEGYLFVDRNGVAFRDVLEFLRTGQPVVPSVPAHTLYVEADFYQLQGFQLVSDREPSKEVHLPAERVRRERLRALYAEYAGRRGLRKRYIFPYEELPTEMRLATHIGKRGAKGCLYEDQLVALGFRQRLIHNSDPIVQHYPSGLCCPDAAIVKPSNCALCFERTIRTSWVDLQKFDLLPGMWDVVDIVQEGLVAQVTAFE